MNFIPLLLCAEISDPARRRLHGRLVAVCSAAGIFWGLFAFGLAAIFLAATVAFAYRLRGLAARSATRLRAALAARSAAVAACHRESSVLLATAAAWAKLVLAVGLAMSFLALIRRRLALLIPDLNLTPLLLPIPRPSWRGWGA